MITMDMLDGWWAAYSSIMLLSLYFATQALYSLSLLVDGYLFSRPVNMIDMGERFQLVPGSNKDYPPIVLFYPVLDEQESVMRTTMIALDELEYPKDRYRVIAIPNSNDLRTMNARRIRSPSAGSSATASLSRSTGTARTSTSSCAMAVW